MKFKRLLTLLALVAFAGFTYPAEAAMKLRLSDGSSQLEIQDGLANDSCAASGVICFLGNLNGWLMNITTGTSKPVMTGGLGLQSLDIRGGSGTLVISLTDTDFGPTNYSPTGLHNLKLSAAGIMASPGGSLTLQGYQSNTNAEYAQTNTTGAAVFASSLSPFSGSTSGGPVNLVGPYSVTQVATVSFGAGGGYALFSSDLGFAPEPTTLVLLGGVLLLTGRALRRRATRT